MKLKRSQKCPLHHSYYCCGREMAKRKERAKARRPVERVEDPHHPRGYRELRDWRKLPDGPLRKAFADANAERQPKEGESK